MLFGFWGAARHRNSFFPAPAAPKTGNLILPRSPKESPISPRSPKISEDPPTPRGGRGVLNHRFLT